METNPENGRPASPGPSPKTFAYRMKASSSYKPKKNSDRQELLLKKGEIVTILNMDDGSGWMKGKKENNDSGWFPKSCVRELSAKDGRISPDQESAIDSRSISRKYSMDVLEGFLQNRPPPETLEEKGVLPKKSILKTLSFWRKKSDNNTNTDSSGSAFTPVQEKRSRSPTANLSDSGNNTKATDSGSKGKKPQENTLGSSQELLIDPKAENIKAASDDSPEERESPPVAKVQLTSPRTVEDSPKKKRFLANNSSKKKEKEKKKKEDTSKDEREEEEVDESKPLYAKCFADLPEDLQKKIQKAKVDEEKVNRNFEVMCNVLRFTTKRNVITDTGKDKKEKERHSSSESNLPPQMVKAAEEFVHYVNPKKLYKKAEFAGKGGFGRVYYAKSVKEKTTVAIKKMPHVTSKEKRMNIDEISVLNMCEHPNIVNYFKSYIYEGEVAVIMEYMEGGSLSEAVKKYSFEEPQIAYVAREMLQGIAYLHKNNLVHRDLKSANVMLSTKGHVKLIDFGLTVDIAKCRLHMVGSPFWMPPVIRAEPHGFKADIWSFAICLIEMADRKPPNRKARILAMFVTGTEGLIPFVKESNYSPLFKDFLSKCLLLNPEERASTEDLLMHPFINTAANPKSMENVLREIFLTNAFENSGLFM